jgi:hypothetical protein
VAWRNPAFGAQSRRPVAPAIAELKKAGTTALKSKIRDLTRLLQKKDLDLTVKQHKEHELARVQQQLAAQEAENKAAAIDAKYKTIKFYGMCRMSSIRYEDADMSEIEISD